MKKMVGDITNKVGVVAGKVGVYTGCPFCIFQ